MTIETVAATTGQCYIPCISESGNGLKDTTASVSAAWIQSQQTLPVKFIPDQSKAGSLRNCLGLVVQINSSSMRSDISKRSMSQRNKDQAVLPSRSVSDVSKGHMDCSYRVGVTSHSNVTLLNYPVILISSLIRHLGSHLKLSSRSFCWWHTFLLVTFLAILLLPNSSNCSTDSASSSRNVAITDFSQTEKREYSEPGDVWFHYLNVDPKNPQYIYVGAVDYIYRFDVADISKVPMKSPNISQSSTAQANYSTMYRAYVDTCRRALATKNVDLNYECRNHIRVIQPLSSGELYICATGPQSPQEFYVEASTLQLTNVGYISSSLNGAGSGFYKCPYSPNTPSVSLYSDQGGPRNASVLYSGTLALQDYRYTFYRSNVGRNLRSDQTVVSLTTSDGKETLKNDMSYVAVYDIDQYIYFFFREIAIEFTDYDKIFVSRVGRICKNDEGGESFTGNNFMTYVKTRIVCPNNAQSKTPFYFNEIADVWFDSTKRVFYGLFRANSGNLGSAVCVFDLANVNDQFDKGQFYGLDQTNSKWIIEQDSKVPQIRPSSCAYNRTIPPYPQTFAVNHVLMYGSVKQILATPPFQSTQLTYSKMLVDKRQGYPVLYLYDDTRPLEISRMVLWSEGGSTADDWKSGGSGQFRMLTSLKPFLLDETPMWQMILDAGLQKSWLFAVKDSRVTQLTLTVCAHYFSCTSCAGDPYCAWNTVTNTCSAFSTGGSMLHEVKDPLSTCSPYCIKKSAVVSVVPEMSVRLTCSSYCEPQGDVIWSLNNTNIDINNSPDTASNFLTTQSNDLIVLGASLQTIGTYRCKSGSVTLAEVSVSLKADDLKGVFLAEYKAWCSEFEKYRQSYDQWVCLKNACLSSGDKCVIDQQSISACQKL